MSSVFAYEMTIEDLQRVLQRTDAATLLVPPRILRRVIKMDRGMSGLGLQVPHHKSYVVPLANLLKVVELSELAVAPKNQLPDIVILLPLPELSDLSQQARGATLIRYWRLLFHARVHLALSQRSKEGLLGADVIQNRLDRLGIIEVEEITAVLRQENFLLPPGDTRGIYEEFAALYLELRFFAPYLRGRYFPSIASFAAIDALVGEDVDAAKLFAATRPSGTPEPRSPEDLEREQWALSDEGTQKRIDGVAYERLLKQAEEVIAQGNVVRAALLRQRAFEVAPQGGRGAAREAINDALRHLTDRLRNLAPCSEDERADWHKGLRGLLTVTTRGIWPVETRLLFDLQKACVDHEKEIYSVDLVEWARSWGQQPVQRHLPNLTFTLPIKHLRKALDRLVSARLTNEARHAIVPRIRATLHHQEERARQHFRPLIQRALEEADFKPANQSEKLARDRMIEELLDRAIECGFLNIGDLRDAIARGSMKLPDLSGPVEFLRGDRLLVANRRFGIHLDGVYHRAEVYLRGLQSFSSLAFGTTVGRLLTLYLILPLLGAFVALKGAEEIYEIPIKVMHWLTPEFDAARQHPDGEDLATEAEKAVKHTHHGLGFLNIYSFSITALLMLALLHSPPFRRFIFLLLIWLWRGLRAVCYDLPTGFFTLSWVREILQSRPWLIFYLFILKPLIVSLGIALFCYFLRSGRLKAGIVGAVVFPFAVILLNTRFGFLLEETGADAIVRAWELLRDDLLPGLLRSIVWLFRWLGDWLQRWLYSVDEWLRFRRGDNSLWLGIKPILGLFWFAIAYVIRFAWTVLFEPQINPIKHFPVVTVSHKVMLLGLEPTSSALTQYLLQRKLAAAEQAGDAVTEVMRQTMEAELSRWSLGATFMVFACIPGVFGFMAWELMSNWRLYKTNRPEDLEPEVVGSHGETVLRLLRPGFHSGTLPKLYARLRTAERKGQPRRVRQQRVALRHVEHAVGHFVERGLLAVLSDSRSWGGPSPKVGEIDLGINRIRVELRMSAASSSVRLEFEHHEGWLVAGFANPQPATPTWLTNLSPEQTGALNDALAGFYKRAGVDFVREQLEALLPEEVRWRLTEDALVVRTPPGSEATYALKGSEEPIAPRGLIGPLSEALPNIPAKQMFFKQCPIRWNDWVETWERDEAGKGHPTALVPGFRLLPQFSNPQKTS